MMKVSKSFVAHKLAAMTFVLALLALACASPAYADAGEGAMPESGLKGAQLSEFDIPAGAVSGTWGSGKYAAPWYLADGGATLVVGPGIVCSSGSYLSSGDVAPDFGGSRATIRTVRFTGDAYVYPTASELFAGFESIEFIEGMSRLSGEYGVLGADSMFAGCRLLKAISLSDMKFPGYSANPYTGEAVSVSDKPTTCEDAFAGCTSLETLDLGPGWESGYVGPAVFGPEDIIYDNRATFPVDMTDGTTVYAAGSPVPNGEGHYVRVAAPGVERISVSGAAIPSRVYTGQAIAPAVVVGGSRLAEGVDYTCAVKDARGRAVPSGKGVAAGMYEVAITGIGSYKGTTKATFTVKRASVKGVTVPRLKARAYTGRAIKPSPKLVYNGKTLKRGVDYTLSYKHNKNRGIAIVKIKGKGNFKGEKNAAFRIA